MSNPQHAAGRAGGQPDLRPGRSATPGPVPPANRPGHLPEREQDEPAEPAHPPAPSGAEPAHPPTTAGAGPDPAPADVQPDPAPPEAPRAVRFPFEFDARFVPLGLAFGVLPTTAYIEVEGGELRVRFGPWSLTTPVDNVADVTPSGPYRWWRVAGPPRLSLADRGITFATTAAGGLCLQFREPVPAALPTRLLRHPSATVTVATPATLADALGFGERFGRSGPG